MGANRPGSRGRGVSGAGLVTVRQLTSSCLPEHTGKVEEKPFKSVRPSPNKQDRPPASCDGNVRFSNISHRCNRTGTSWP